MRSQRDSLQQQISRSSGLDCSDDKDRARQEFKDETDTNQILNRFGVDLAQRPVEYGKETDYNMDLQQALAAVAQAKDTYRQMPNDLQRRYPTWQRFLNAVERGQLQLTKTDKTNKDVPPEQAALSVTEPPPKKP